MGRRKDYLFKRFHKWAKNQDENFNTECSTYLLELLRYREPILAAAVLDQLSGRPGSWSRSDASAITITTQVREEGHQPDIWIRGLDRLLLVEVKVEEGPREGQLLGYRKLLKKKAQEARVELARSLK